MPEKKKKGDKPKKKDKIVKKRGRKPKGGKIIKKTSKLQKKNDIIIPNIILHLKCFTNELEKKSETFFSNFQYNPDNINNIESYSMLKNKKQGNNVDNYEKINKKNKIISQDETKKNTTVKIIWEKLNNLSKQLRNNDCDNKNSDCFWCTYPFDTQPFYIPTNVKKKVIDVYGCFCSPECSVAYLMNERIDSSVLWERYSLLNNIYGKILKYKKNIKPAPNPFYTLEKYYGNLTIEEYRKLLKIDNLLLVVDKPLTKILPEVHEDNNDIPKIYSNLLDENNEINFVYRLKSKKKNSNKKKLMKDNFNFS
tara:strand:- start:409 stop:1335 length:927 start_codon:yes stop_codon:yes gene_type:complete